jgi:cell wall-associated NlpC family hydrolase
MEKWKQGLSNSEIKIREVIIKESLEWQRTKFHHQGAIKGVGVDCAQFLIKVFHSCSLIPDLKITDYPMQYGLHGTEEKYLGWVRKYAVEIPVAEAQPGDIALFRFGRVISHGAIIIEWPIVIHAYNPTGVILDDATKFPLGDKDRLKGVFSLCQFSSALTPAG